MVLSMIVCYIALIQMMLHKNTLKFGLNRSLSDKIFGVIILSALIIVYLLSLDLVFAFVGLALRALIQVLNVTTRGRVKS